MVHYLQLGADACRNRGRCVEHGRVGVALLHRQVRRESVAVGSRVHPGLCQLRHHQHHDPRRRYSRRTTRRRHGLACLLRQSTCVAYCSRLLTAV